MWEKTDRSTTHDGEEVETHHTTRQLTKTRSMIILFFRDTVLERQIVETDTVPEDGCCSGLGREGERRWSSAIVEGGTRARPGLCAGPWSVTRETELKFFKQDVQHLGLEEMIERLAAKHDISS